MATFETLDEYLESRSSWPKFWPLENPYKTTAPPHAFKTLTAEILDKHHDLRMRNSDILNAMHVLPYFRKSMEKKEFIDSIAEGFGLEVVECTLIPQLAIKTRHQVIHQLLIHVDSFVPDPFPTELEARAEMAQRDYDKITTFIRNEKWYNESYYTRLGPEPDKDYGPNLEIKLSYRGVVPDFYMTAIHYRVCCKMCPHVEPLLFYWQAIMTEVYVRDGDRLYTDNSNWLAMEKTALLVIFFLQHCELLPLLMREEEELLPANLSMARLQKWSDGEDFFDDYFYKKHEQKAQQSPFYKLSVGELFIQMIHFFTEPCALNIMKINFDAGTYEPQNDEGEEHWFILETILISDYRKSYDVDMPMKKMYWFTMTLFLEHLESHKQLEGLETYEDFMQRIRRQVEITTVEEVCQIATEALAEAERKEEEGEDEQEDEEEDEEDEEEEENGGAEGNDKENAEEVQIE